MLLQYAEPGGEKYLPYARKKLRQWKEQLLKTGLRAFARVVHVSDGSVIYIDSVLLKPAVVANSVLVQRPVFRDRIRITAGGSFGVSYFFDPIGSSIALASVSRSGAVLGPSRYRFYLAAATFSPAAFAYLDSGILGSETGVIDVTGANTYTAALDSRAVVQIMAFAFFGLDTGKFEAHLAYLDDSVANPFSAGASLISFDPAAGVGSQWSEVTEDLYLASAISAGIGISSLDVSTWYAPRNTYTLASPFPGGAGGSVVFSTPMYAPQLEGGVIPTGVLQREFVARIVKSYITAATPSTVYADYDVAHVLLAYGCYVALEGTDETWVYTRDPDTLVLSEHLHSTRTWTQHVWLVKRVDTADTFITPNDPALAIHNHTSNPLVVMEGTTGDFSGISTAGLGGSASPWDIEGRDEAGDVVVVRGNIVWDAAVHSASAGAMYVDIAGASHRTELWEGVTGQANVEAFVNGVSVWSASGTASAFLFNTTAPGLSWNAAGLAKMRNGMFGFAYDLVGAGNRTGAFWTGAAMLTDAAPATSVNFVWAVSDDSSVYVFGWNENYIRYYDNGVLKLTITLAAGENFVALDEDNPRIFYTTRVGAGFGNTVIYTVKASDWSSTSAEFALADTWTYQAVDYEKYLGDDFVTPHSGRDPGTRRVVVE